MSDRRIDATTMTEAEIAARLDDIKRRNGKRGYGDISRSSSHAAISRRSRSRSDSRKARSAPGEDRHLLRLDRKLNRVILARKLLEKSA